MTEIINRFQKVLQAAAVERERLRLQALEVQNAWNEKREAWLAQLHRSNGRVRFVRNSPAWGQA